MTKENNNIDRVEKELELLVAELEGTGDSARTANVMEAVGTAIEEARREERREIITAYKQTTGIDDDVFIRALND